MGMKVQAYLYDGHWEDIGTIEAFYDANLVITKKPIPDFSFYDRSSPIYTQARFYPHQRCWTVMSQTVLLEKVALFRIFHSVVGLRSWVAEGAIIEDALLMGVDYYEIVNKDDMRRHLERQMATSSKVE